VSSLCPSYGVGETDPVKAAKLVKESPDDSNTSTPVGVGPA